VKTAIHITTSGKLAASNIKTYALKRERKLRVSNILKLVLKCGAG
jgi:hypothetical protein